MENIFKQIQKSSFEKKKGDSTFKIQLKTIYGILNISLRIDDDNSIFVFINHNEIQQAFFTASIEIVPTSNLYEILNNCIKEFFEEISESYTNRLSVQ